MKSDIFCFLPITIVFLYITVKFRTHYPTKYTKYQQYLFDIIKGYREQSVSKWTWKKIVDILNSKNSRFNKFISHAKNYIQEIDKCEFMYSMVGYRVLLPGLEKTDERLTSLKNDGKYINIFSYVSSLTS